MYNAFNILRFKQRGGLIFHCIIYVSLHTLFTLHMYCTQAFDILKRICKLNIQILHIQIVVIEFEKKTNRLEIEIGEFDLHVCNVGC